MSTGQGQAITGLEYQKLDHGPALRRLLPLQQALIRARDAHLVPVAKGRYVQRRLVALRAPDLSQFSAPEIAIVDATLHRLRDVNAAGISELSHQADGWKAAALGETIPYTTAFWGWHELSSDDMDRARQLSTAAS